MGIKPKRLLDEIRRLARSHAYAPVSEKYLRNLRAGKQEPTPGRIRTIVAAMRCLTMLHVRAADLFDVEPSTAGLASEHVFGHPDPWRNRTRGVAVFWIPRARRGGRSRLRAQQAYVNGRQALETLYRELSPLMVLTAHLRWDVPRADAEGLVHDVFASFLEREPQVNDVRAYLLGATRHACRHYWRKRRHETAMPDDLLDTFEAERQQKWALRMSMVEALASMGARCLDVLQRFYLHRESVHTIAEHLDVTPAYVYQILYGCRNQLRELVYGAGKRNA